MVFKIMNGTKESEPCSSFPILPEQEASVEDGRQRANSSSFLQHAIAWWRSFASETWGQEFHELKVNENVYGKQNKASNSNNNKVFILFYWNNLLLLHWLQDIKLTLGVGNSKLLSKATAFPRPFIEGRKAFQLSDSFWSCRSILLHQHMQKSWEIQGRQKQALKTAPFTRDD